MLISVIVLLFEVLYYSLFMKLTRRQGKIYNYFILFVIISLIVSFANVKQFNIYFIFVFLTYIGLKYIARTKVSFYEVLVIIAMLLLNIVIELPIYLIAYKVLHISRFLTTIIFDVVKVLAVILLSEQLNIAYLRCKLLWNKNNFYIRYITSILIYLYVITTIVLLMLYR